MLQGVTHRGIAQAVQIRDHHGSPAILFHHDPSDVRLDSYLAVNGERLTREIRLDLVRQLAEVRGRLAEPGDDRTVLFLHDGGLVGRYAAAGGQELLVGLQAAARSPATAPHGLWLLPDRAPGNWRA